MKASDLMVGDLVYVVRGYDKHLTIEKIKGIIEDEDNPYPVTVSTNETVSLNDISPIPLTEEILVKNGFRIQVVHDNGKWLWITDNSWLAYSERHDYWYYEDVKITYVHQLQHLMRLYGIDK